MALTPTPPVEPTHDQNPPAATQNATSFASFRGAARWMMNGESALPESVDADSERVRGGLTPQYLRSPSRLFVAFVSTGEIDT